MLHDDKIGSLSLPAGAYTVTLRDSAALSCAHASDYFRQFLEDWDGKLPRPWRYSVQGTGLGTFRRGSSSVGFSVAPALAAVAEAAGTIRSARPAREPSGCCTTTGSGYSGSPRATT